MQCTSLAEWTLYGQLLFDTFILHNANSSDHPGVGDEAWDVCFMICIKCNGDFST